MYSVVLLAAISAADGSAGMGWKGYPTPTYHDSSWPGGYQNLNGGYHWPGYACWGGCGGYASPAYGVPMTPLLNPPPPRVVDPDEGKKNGDGKDRKKPAGDGADEDTPKTKKGTPKKPPDDDGDGKTSALITIFLPAGAKLSVDGRPVTAAGVKTFVTPPLRKGSAYYYEVTIEMTRDGKPITQRRRIRLTAGESVHADYRDLGGSMAAKK